jgi:hypothetical protein
LLLTFIKLTKNNTLQMLAQALSLCQHCLKLKSDRQRITRYADSHDISHCLLSDRDPCSALVRLESMVGAVVRDIAD